MMVVGRRVPAALALVSAFALGVAACGSGGSPSAPSSPSTTLQVPSSFRIVLQRVFFTSNEVRFAWSGNGTSYRVLVGTAPGMSDAHTAEVAGTEYTWSAPREGTVYYARVLALRGSETSAASIEFPVYTIDLRHVIDALFFRSGPMADTPDNALGNPSAAVWPDGTSVRVVVTSALGEEARANAQRFADEYASEVGGAITATSEMTSETFASTSFPSGVPLFTIYARELNPFCGAGAIGCAFYGPSPVGPSRSLITIALASNGNRAMEHEMGHAYGMGHVHATAAVRPELNFMMNPQYVSQHMTEPEKNAIRAARDGGLRPGWTRSQAVAAGLVLPYTPGANFMAGLTAISGPRPQPLCRILDTPGFGADR